MKRTRSIAGRAAELCRGTARGSRCGFGNCRPHLWTHLYQMKNHPNHGQDSRSSWSWKAEFLRHENWSWGRLRCTQGLPCPGGSSCLRGTIGCTDSRQAASPAPLDTRHDLCPLISQVLQSNSEKSAASPGRPHNYSVRTWAPWPHYLLLCVVPARHSSPHCPNLHLPPVPPVLMAEHKHPECRGQMVLLCL